MLYKINSGIENDRVVPTLRTPLLCGDAVGIISGRSKSVGKGRTNLFWIISFVFTTRNLGSSHPKVQ
jgi:hypothetical protein